SDLMFLYCQISFFICTFILATHLLYFSSSFFFNNTATTEIYTLSLHDLFRSLIIDLEKIPILLQLAKDLSFINILPSKFQDIIRSEEHTSELQSRRDLVCRLLLEKKNKDTLGIFQHTKYLCIHLLINIQRSPA